MIESLRAGSEAASALAELVAPQTQLLDELSARAYERGIELKCQCCVSGFEWEPGGVLSAEETRRLTLRRKSLN